LKKLDEYLDLLQGYGESVDRSDLHEDATIRGSIERHLQLAAEAMIDIGNHVVAARGLTPPEDYRGTFAALDKAGVISSDFAKRLRGWAGFRNVLVHDYLDVDLDVVWRTLREELGDIEEFIDVFSRFLE